MLIIGRQYGFALVVACCILSVTCPNSSKRSHSKDSKHSDQEGGSIHSGSSSDSEGKNKPFVPRSDKRNAVLYPEGVDIPPTRPSSPTPGSDSDSPEHLTEEEIQRRRREKERQERNKKPFKRPGSTGTFGGGHHEPERSDSEHSDHEHEPNKHRPSGTGSPNRRRSEENVEGGFRSRQNSLSSQNINHPTERRGSQSSS